MHLKRGIQVKLYSYRQKVRKGDPFGVFWDEEKIYVTIADSKEQAASLFYTEFTGVPRLKAEDVVEHPIGITSFTTPLLR